MSRATDPSVRHDAVFLFDISDGNPNGDPDAGNRPRVDPETDQGLVTDVSIKRKIRDTVGLASGGADGYEIFVTAGTFLNQALERSYEETGTPLDEKTKKTLNAADARQWLCARYFDVRLFGAVLSTGKTSGLGQVRGPVQVSFARSVDPVVPVEHTITRVAHTTETDAAKGGGTMGNKWTIPYGLYVCTLSYSASRGAQTGVSERDLELLYQCLINMFDHTSSAARASMSSRGLFVFSHPDAFGRAPMQALVDRVGIVRADGVDVPRRFADYQVTLDEEGLPQGVTVERLL